MSPMELLRYHVTGAIDRGEAQAIHAITAQPKGGSMEQFVYINYDDNELECIVEYAMVGESDTDDKCLVPEVTNVFLPDGLQHLDKKTLGEIKVQALEEFYLTC